MSLAAHHVGWVDLFGGAALIHAFAHTIGGMWRVPHGFACAVVLPYILKLTTNAMPKSRLFKLAEALEIEPKGLSTNKVASKVITANKFLLKDVNAPTLRDLGTKRTDLQRIIEEVLKWKKYFQRSVVVPSPLSL